MNTKIISQCVRFIGVLAVFAPLRALGAESFLPQCALEYGTCNTCDLIALFATLSQYVVQWASGIILLTMILGGLYMLISAGNSQKVDKGKEIIIGSIIGLTLVVAGYTIVNFSIASFLGGKPQLFGNTNWAEYCENTNQQFTPPTNTNGGATQDTCNTEVQRGMGTAYSGRCVQDYSNCVSDPAYPNSSVYPSNSDVAASYKYCATQTTNKVCCAYKPADQPQTGSQCLNDRKTTSNECPASCSGETCTKSSFSAFDCSKTGTCTCSGGQCIQTCTATYATSTTSQAYCLPSATCTTLKGVEYSSDGVKIACPTSTDVCCVYAK